jgi:hypothetical protein
LKNQIFSEFINYDTAEPLYNEPPLRKPWYKEGIFWPRQKSPKNKEGVPLFKETLFEKNLDIRNFLKKKVWFTIEPLYKEISNKLIFNMSFLEFWWFPFGFFKTGDSNKQNRQIISLENKENCHWIGKENLWID